MNLSDKLSRTELVSFTRKIRHIKPLLIGDLCIDIYWNCDMTKSLLSRETPFFPLPVVGERISLGAGGNVVNCIKSLGVDKLSVIGVSRNDWRGECLINLLNILSIPQDSILTENTGFTNAYIKPMQFGYSGDAVEGSRIDFENDKPISTKTEEDILFQLDKKAADSDILIVCDQFSNGILTKRVREKIRSLAKSGLPVTVDSRTNIGEYSGAILKPNEIECARALGIPQIKTPSKKEDYFMLAESLSEKTKSQVCMTLGKNGAYAVSNSGNKLIPAILRNPPFDIVGAGDCFLSAFSCALAAGYKIDEAALFGNMASAITVKKIGETGSASPEELIKLYDDNVQLNEEYI